VLTPILGDGFHATMLGYRFLIAAEAE